MPFSLKNAAQAFQKMMDGILKDIQCVFVYLDAILVASPDKETHAANLRRVFSLLAQNGISINKRMCVLGQPSVKYLGHMVNAKGIASLPSPVQDLQDFPAPKTKVGLQLFLHMLNYYRRFVPSLSHRLCLLHQAVATARKPKDFEWTPECGAAFSSAKAVLALSLIHI